MRTVRHNISPSLITMVVLCVVLLFAFVPSAGAEAPPWDEEAEEEEEYTGIFAQSMALGVSIGRVEGLSQNLSDLAGPDNGAIILEWTQNDYANPYASDEYQIAIILVNNFNMLQLSYGIRLSTVPFPKVFLRPWAGAYITFNMLEDLRENDPLSQEEEFDGIGVGVAAALGVTMRLDDSFALEAAFRGDQIFTSGWLDTGEFYNDRFGVRGAYFRVLFFFK